jgi:NADPH-dependent F420 reductase
VTSLTIAVVGGTGHLGNAIAARLARSGHAVIIGSRNSESAQAAAAAIGNGARGMANRDAAEAADLIIVAVPWAAHQATYGDIAPATSGKVVVDTTVPLVPPKVMRVQLPPQGCAALAAQALLPQDARVVSAFHNVAAHKLAQDVDVACDVLVFGDDKAARAEVVQLCTALGLRGLHAGALANSAAAEALTSSLIFLNKTYRLDGAGSRITGELDIREEGS